MLSILGITGPIYLTILISYLAVRQGMFARADMPLFGRFVINLALPAMLFNALAQRRLAEVLNTSYLLAYLTGTLLVIGIGLWWARRILGKSLTGGSMYAMGMSCSNSGFVGYPVLLLSLAPVAGVALALNMVIENLVVIPLLLALAERGRSGASGGPWYRLLGQATGRLLANPMILGLAAGFAASWLEWTPPGPITRTINLFASASGVLSLFVIGGTLVGLPLRGLGRQVAPILLGKLVLHPLLVLLCLLALAPLGLVAVEPQLRSAAVLLAGMPMMGIYPILAQKYGQGDLSAAALLAATVVSFMTVSMMLWASHAVL